MLFNHKKAYLKIKNCLINNTVRQNRVFVKFSKNLQEHKLYRLPINLFSGKNLTTYPSKFIIILLNKLLILKEINGFIYRI